MIPINLNTLIIVYHIYKLFWWNQPILGFCILKNNVLNNVYR